MGPVPAAILVVLVRRPLPIALSLLGAIMLASRVHIVYPCSDQDNCFAIESVLQHPGAMLKNVQGTRTHFIYAAIASFAICLFVALLIQLVRRGADRRKARRATAGLS